MDGSMDGKEREGGRKMWSLTRERNKLGIKLQTLLGELLWVTAVRTWKHLPLGLRGMWEPRADAASLSIGVVLIYLQTLILPVHCL